jgi:hypothetical protein
MNLAYLHLLLNHFPTIGFGVGLGLFLVAVFAKSEDLKRASLVIFVMVALLTIPVYVTGSAAQGVIKGDSGVSDTLVTAHKDDALLAFVFMQLTGLAAWLGLWQSSRHAGLVRWNLSAIVVLSIVTFGFMARAANIGGEIRHPEIVSAQGETAAEETPNPEPEWLRSASVASFVIDYAWVWSICETLHFIGLVLLFSVVVLNLRMLGVMKKVSFAALHRLLPWAIVGFAINSITGMMFFIAAADQYTNNPAFYWKMLFIVLSGVNVLYLTVSDDAAAVKPGDDAPLSAKVMAASGIFLWFGVVFWGRLLPFLGLQF